MAGYSINFFPETDRSRSFYGSVRHILEQKNIAPAVTFILATVLSIMATLPMASEMGYKAGLLVIVGILALPVAVTCLTNLKAGVVIVIVLSFFVLGIKRLLGDVPIGTVIDGLISLMAAGLFISAVQKRSLPIGTNAVSIFLIVWMFYNLIQVFNPEATSQLAWVYTVRGMAGFMVLYFIMTYAITTVKYVEILIWLWLVLAFIAACYGCWQEYVGFQRWEMAWIMESEERFNLFFIHGRFRKFSFLSDPMVFGFVCAYTAMMCITMLMGKFNPIVKGILGIFIVVFLLGMVASGTRSAFVMIPAGLVFFTIITFKRWIILASMAFLVMLTVVVLMPTVNNVHFRIQTAFKPATDDSYKVRANNQKKIQPYIQSHPIGGGLGTVGVWGKKFSPENPLSQFPPDSGYMRIVVETGYIGLFLYLSLVFIAMYTGIKNYFQMKNERLKIYMLGALCTFYVLILANFPQEAIMQFPTNPIFFFLLALLTKLKNLEDELPENNVTV